MQMKFFGLLLVFVITLPAYSSTCGIGELSVKSQKQKAHTVKSLERLHSKLPLPDIEDAVFDVRIPGSGILEVELDPDRFTTRVFLDFEEFPQSKYVDIGETKRYTLTKSQVVSLELINYPSNDCAYVTNAISPGSGFSATANQQGWQTDTWDFTVSDAGGGILKLRYRYVQLTLSPSGQPLITCKEGEGPYTGDFERGFCYTVHCGNSPESWVRGRADLDPATGQVGLLMELETDALDAGPKGVMKATFKDTNGKVLATVQSKEAGIGGKRPGHSYIENVAAKGQLPINLANQVDSIEIEAACKGYVQSYFHLLPAPLEVKWEWHF